MIALQRMAHPHRDPALSQVELKTEPNMGLPDPSILPSKYYEDEDDVMSSTDSDEHSSSSEKKKRPGRKKGQSKLIYTYVVKSDFKCQVFKNSTKYFIFFYYFFQFRRLEMSMENFSFIILSLNIGIECIAHTYDF